MIPSSNRPEAGRAPASSAWGWGQAQPSNADRRPLTIPLPLTRPGIVAGSILVFIPAIGAYVTPTLLGGGKQLMIGNLIALQFGSSRDWPFGCAAALILLAMVMVALLFYVRNTQRGAVVHG